MSAVVDPAVTHDRWLALGERLTELIELDAERFAYEWAGLSINERLELRSDVRVHCIEAYKRIRGRVAVNIPTFTQQGRHLGQPELDAEDVAPVRPAYADFATLDTDPPAERAWIVDQWIPQAAVTGLFGVGGVGKSLLAQQIATAVATGERILGAATLMGPVIGLHAEDDNDELRRRQIAILNNLHRSAASAADLHLEGRAGMPNCLGSFDAERRLLISPLLDQLERECRRLGPRLVVLDNIAQLYSGSENDRYLVTTFCNELTALARRHRCGVLLLGHPGKSEGSEYSGSTAWDGAVRSRLWMERRADDQVVLHRRKANYASQGDVTLEYRYGAFAEVDVVAAIGTTMQDARRVLLAALDTLTTRHIATSPNPPASTYLVRLAMREGLVGDVPELALRRALAELIDAGEIVPGVELGWKKPDRHPATGLARRSA
ncbi:MAG TPA: AAA family ATPase [Burkholderiaceae bacterium]|nr:AAA family ATPase [Burkholderiaceae bacterium]